MSFLPGSAQLHSVYTDKEETLMQVGSGYGVSMERALVTLTTAEILDTPPTGRCVALKLDWRGAAGGIF